MKKLFSLVAMMFCVIAGWAQKAPETPIYFQIPASPYVVDLTAVNCKVGNTQTWISSENNTWNTAAPATTGWHGKWTNMDTAEPVFVPYDDPTWQAASADYGFEGQAVRDNGSSLFLYVRNITSVTGFFVDNNGKRTLTVKVYDKEGNLVKENSVTGTGSKANIVTVDGLDASVTGYKVELTSNNKNCWIQAVKLEGTAKERYIPNFYLEQDANVIKAVGLAEGEALRYKKFINEDIPSGTSISGDDEEFPSKGLSFTPGDTLKLRIRAYDKNGNASATWTHTYDLPVPTITDNYVAIKSIAKLDINEETGEWKTSIPYNAWSQAYDNLNKVQWTTTSTDYQYIYKVVPGYEKIETLNGDSVEVPVVAMNRKNMMYFITEAPSIIKVTSAPIYKNPSSEKSGSVTVGKNIELDGVRYTVDDKGTIILGVDKGVHTFSMTNKPELGFQMLEIMKAATIAPGADLAAYVKENAALIAAQKFAPIALQEGEYTLNDTLLIPIKAFINGNGAKLTIGEKGCIVAANDLTVANMTVDATASTSPLLSLSATPVVPEVNSYYRINEIKLANVTATGLKNSLLYDNNTKYCVVNLVVDNCVLGLATTEVKNEALISFQAGGAKDFTIKNSTVYGNGDVAKYFIRYNNAARLDRYGYDKETEFQVMTYQNNTFYNLLKSDGQWGNYSAIAGQDYIKFNIQNNIWYNASNEVIRRLAGGRFGGNAPLTFAKNTYFYNSVDNSEKEASYDKSEDILTTDPMFKDAANGNFTPNASSDQVLYKTGDPRWVANVEYVAPIEAPETAKYFWAANAAGYVTEVGGKATANAEAEGRVNYPNSGYYTICLNGAKDFSTGVVTVALDNALAAGDVIRITAYQNKDAEGKKTGAKLRFNGDDNNILATADDVYNNIHPDFATGDGKPNTVELTVTDAQAGCTAFEMTRVNTGTNLFITVLEIVPYEVVVPVENAIAAPAVQNGAIFNLAGQKVGADYKGIVIKNGKKYMVK